MYPALVMVMLSSRDERSRSLQPRLESIVSGIIGVIVTMWSHYQTYRSSSGHTWMLATGDNICIKQVHAQFIVSRGLSISDATWKQVFTNRRAVEHELRLISSMIRTTAIQSNTHTDQHFEFCIEDAVHPLADIMGVSSSSFTSRICRYYSTDSFLVHLL